MAKRKKHGTHRISSNPHPQRAQSNRRKRKQKRPPWLPFIISGCIIVVLMAWSLIPVNKDSILGEDHGDYLQFAALASGKPEVTIFYSYACPHCFKTHETLIKATESLPNAAKIDWVQVPFYPPNADTAQAMMFAAAIGVHIEQSHALNREVFHGYHVDKSIQNAEDVEAQVDQWLTANGYEERFADLALNDSVRDRVSEMNYLTDQAPIRGVPAVMVNGEFQLKLEKLGTEQALRELLGRLIRRY